MLPEAPVAGNAWMFGLQVVRYPEGIGVKIIFEVSIVKINVCVNDGDYAVKVPDSFQPFSGSLAELGCGYSIALFNIQDGWQIAG